MTNWPCHVINLARNTTRLARVTAELDAAGMDWQRLEAVNGWELTPEEIADVYDAGRNRAWFKADLVPPEIGIFLSQYTAWKQIAESDAPGGIVLEDDFALLPGFAETIADICADKGPWDIVKLFTLNAQPKVLAERTLAGGTRLVLPYKVPTTMLGYVIRRDAARHLVQNSLPLHRPVDDDHKYFWQHGLNIALALPCPLALGEQTAETGTIGAARRKAPKTGRLMRRLRFTLSYSLMLHLTRLRQRLMRQCRV